MAALVLDTTTTAGTSGLPMPTRGGTFGLEDGAGDTVNLPAVTLPEGMSAMWGTGSPHPAQPHFHSPIITELRRSHLALLAPVRLSRTGNPHWTR